ncbi:hypothetical protein [Agrobacterium tumefaciens]|uniref:hypothetical protein n=1 Tax=Agrobacterium tumefaciens TaxID=358 RepID=UPI001574DBA7|nr:hypothetical protein [Agrobacterium tumefaciens]
MDERQTASEDLRVRIATIHAVQGNDQAAVDAATARNILHEELGYFSDPQTGYSIDEATRNRLLAHTRQDAAHAVLAVASLAGEVRKLRRLAKVAVALLAVLTVAVIPNLFR